MASCILSTMRTQIANSSNGSPDAVKLRWDIHRVPPASWPSIWFSHVRSPRCPLSPLPRCPRCPRSALFRNTEVSWQSRCYCRIALTGNCALHLSRGTWSLGLNKTHMAELSAVDIIWPSHSGSWFVMRHNLDASPQVWCNATTPWKVFFPRNIVAKVMAAGECGKLISIGSQDFLCWLRF